jgi:hypothetical protein
VALKEQIFNMRLPHQDLSFTVHGLDAADDVALSIAFAASLKTRVVPSLTASGDFKSERLQVILNCKIYFCFLFQMLVRMAWAWAFVS